MFDPRKVTSDGINFITYFDRGNINAPIGKNKKILGWHHLGNPGRKVRVTYDCHGCYVTCDVALPTIASFGVDVALFLHLKRAISEFMRCKALCVSNYLMFICLFIIIV